MLDPGAGWAFVPCPEVAAAPAAAAEKGHGGHHSAPAGGDEAPASAAPCAFAVLAEAAVPPEPAGFDPAPPPPQPIGLRLAEAASTKEGIDAERLAETTTVMNVEDSLRYLPSLTVRKRHVGDTQAPLATRTSGVGASARSLIYADGLLLSALIGNNNSTASPRWGMVAPEEIERVDVIYGPFAADYAGNSIGGVVNITTRMPESFEASSASRWG